MVQSTVLLKKQLMLIAIWSSFFGYVADINSATIFVLLLPAAVVFGTSVYQIHQVSLEKMVSIPFRMISTKSISFLCLGNQ